MIKRIQIENFKSFGKVDLKPHPRVNLLIGPNSSGKSNFLEALVYRELNGDRLLENPKTNRKRLKTDWTIRLEFDNLEVEAIDSILGPNEGTTSLLKFYHILNSGRQIKYESEDYGSNTNYVTTKQERDEADANGKLEDLDIFFISYINSINSESKEFKLTQQVISQPFLLEKNTKSLLSDFSNISGFIYSLIQEDDETYSRICNDLYQITKEFDLLKSPISKTGNGKIELAIRDSIEKKNYLIKDVSEGVSYFVALLCLLHQPNPPKVILLEEIENGIHPRRLSEIISLIWKLAEEKGVQFFITTHSPVVLDQFTDYPECVLIFDKKYGITEIQNLEKIIETKHAFAKANGLPELDYTAELSENWLWGLLNGVPDIIQT